MIYVSICIPTKDRIEYLQQTISSIIDDYQRYEEYEIVISDNSDNLETQEYALYLKTKGVQVVYYKNPVKGFYNSIEALRRGNGELLKLHNDYSQFKKGQFSEFIQKIKLNREKKPLIFFSNATLPSYIDTLGELKSKDLFIRYSSFQNTWSSAFSIWKDQLNGVAHSVDDVDTMFPHTSILLESNFDNYFIDNHEYLENIPVKSKGGYNIFYNFIILYCDILRKIKNKGEISKLTYYSVKLNLFFKFIAPWYYNTVFTEQGYTFDNSNAKEYICKGYSFFGYYTIILMCYLRAFQQRVKGIKLNELG